MSAPPYIAHAGDYLTAIAYRFETTVEKILAEPKNSKLKDARPNPEILAPGDVIYLPAPKRTWVAAKIGGTTSFKASPPIVTVNVVLNDHDGKPFANEAVVTKPVVSATPLTTDGSGTLTLKVSIHVKEIHVTVTSKNRSFMLRVGGLDPHTERSGVISRLRHLGCLGSEDTHSAARPWLAEFAAVHNELILARGVREFQRQNGKDVTGIADDDLQRDLRDAHGC